MMALLTQELQDYCLSDLCMSGSSSVFLLAVFQVMVLAGVWYKVQHLTTADRTDTLHINALSCITSRGFSPSPAPL
jgi:hypothetical protein